MSPNTKTVNCHSLTGDEWISCHQYLSFLVLNLRRYLFTNNAGRRSIQWARGRGGQKFAKFVTLVTALASATVVFIECMSMAFANEYDHVLKLNSVATALWK